MKHLKLSRYSYNRKLSAVARCHKCSLTWSGEYEETIKKAYNHSYRTGHHVSGEYTGCFEYKDEV